MLRNWIAGLKHHAKFEQEMKAVWDTFGDTAELAMAQEGAAAARSLYYLAEMSVAFGMGETGSHTDLLIR